LRFAGDVVDAYLVHEQADHVDHGGDQRVTLEAEALDQPLEEMRGEQRVLPAPR
jgi:hypothetical protein